MLRHKNKQPKRLFTHGFASVFGFYVEDSITEKVNRIYSMTPLEALRTDILMIGGDLKQAVDKVNEFKKKEQASSAN